MRRKILPAFSYNIAVGIIGIAGLIVSLIAMTQVATVLRDNEVNDLRVTLALGLDAAEFTDHFTQDAVTVRQVWRWFVAISIIYFLSSVLLVTAAFTSWGSLTIPWLICEGVCVLCSVVGYIHHYDHHGQHQLENWTIYTAIGKLVVSAWTATVVLSAGMLWSDVTEIMDQTPSGDSSLFDVIELKHSYPVAPPNTVHSLAETQL